MAAGIVPAMPAFLDIPVRRNEAWCRTIYVTDDAGSVIDLTGVTIALQIREKVSDTVIQTAAAEISDAAAGEITVTIDASAGHPLNTYGNPIQTANLPYDLRATDQDGISVDLIAGTVVLSRGITA